MQGLNVRFDIVRLSYIDDDVGGAVETGTFVARSVPGRIHVLPPSTQSLEAGIESPAIADIFMRPRPGTLTIAANDQIVLVSPLNHVNYNQRWRIEGQVRSASMHAMDRNQVYRLRVTRIDTTRTESLM
jgi:hypothetical protein